MVRTCRNGWLIGKDSTKEQLKTKKKWYDEKVGRGDRKNRTKTKAETKKEKLMEILKPRDRK